jgi:hypothetical protein
MKSRRRRNRIREEPSPVDPARHQRCCTVCRHPDREFIEHEFLDWRSPDEIANEHNISGRASIYRHAKATGLLALRRHNACAALELLIERAGDATVSGSCIVRAVRLYIRMNHDGESVAPPKSVHLTQSPTPALNCEPSASLIEPSEPSESTERAEPPLSPASSPTGKGKRAEASEPERVALPPKPPGARQARKPKAARKRTQPDAKHERTEPDAGREGTAREKPTPNPTPNATPNPTPDPTPNPTPTVSAAGYEPAPMVSHPFAPFYAEPGRSPGPRKP